MTKLSLSYANPGSGTSATNLGWINFGNSINNLRPGEAVTNLQISFSNGTTMTFDIENDIASNCSISAVPISQSNSSNFGVTSYTGINGNVVIQADLINSAESSGETPYAIFAFTNIVLKNSSGVAISNNKLFVIADLPPAVGTKTTVYTSSGTGFVEKELVGNPGDTPPDIEPIVPSPSVQIFKSFAESYPNSISVESDSNTATLITETIPNNSIDFEARNTVAESQPSFVFALAVPKNELQDRVSRGINLFL